MCTFDGHVSPFVVGMSAADATVTLMSTLTCPHGCGDLGVFIARRGRRHRIYTGCRTCGYSDWRGGAPMYDDACVDASEGVDPPVEYAIIDVVEGSDPYA